MTPAPNAATPVVADVATKHPSKRGMIHHLDLTVRDPWASVSFYEAVLGHMGYVKSHEYEDGIDFDTNSNDIGFTSIGLVRAKYALPHNRFQPGLHHVAWCADSREDVNKLHETLTAFGATILDAPADYPKYGEGYYALFFCDPDGLKLEYVFLPQGKS